MNLDQLLHFTKVAEHGSFSRAAASLDMSQPAVSRSIRQLEVDLRKTLFHRHGRGIALTDEGSRLLKLATSVLEQIQSAHAVTSQDDSELTGRVAVGLPPSLGRVLGLSLVRSFYARFPRAKLAVVEAFSRELHDRLASDRLDAALLFDPPASTLVTVEPIARQPMGLITARSGSPADDMPITLAELAARRLIMPTLPNSLRMIVEAEATRRGHVLDICCEIDGVEALLNLVRDGFADTVGTADLLRRMKDSDSLVVRPLCEPALDCVVSLATPGRGRRTVLQERTVTLLRELARSYTLH